jgi:CBS domain containing-hemolysin-like protein
MAADPYPDLLAWSTFVLGLSGWGLLLLCASFNRAFRSTDLRLAEVLFEPDSRRQRWLKHLDMHYAFTRWAALLGMWLGAFLFQIAWNQLNWYHSGWSVLFAALLLLLGGFALPAWIIRRQPEKALGRLLPYFNVWERFISRIPGLRFQAVNQGNNPESGEHPAPVQQRKDAELLRNAIRFKNTRLRHCMVPREQIVAVNESGGMEALRRAFIASAHSKIPVYRGTMDHIVGYVHQMVLFDEPKSLDSVILPIAVAGTSTRARDLLRKLIRERRSMAVVLADNGKTAGIVTIEDILEEIFGDIDDEHDEAPTDT